MWSLSTNDNWPNLGQSLSFPPFLVFLENEEDDFNGEHFMGNPSAMKVGGVASLSIGGRLVVEVLLMWAGAAMVRRIFCETEQSRRICRGILRGAGRKFASLPPQQQVDLNLVQREPEPKIQILWRY